VKQTKTRQSARHPKAAAAEVVPVGSMNEVMKMNTSRLDGGRVGPFEEGCCSRLISQPQQRMLAAG